MSEQSMLIFNILDLFHNFARQIHKKPIIILCFIIVFQLFNKKKKLP